MVVKGTDGQRVAAFAEMYLCITHSLSIEYIEFPALRAERFLQAIDRWLLAVDAYAEAQVTTILRLRWNLGGADCIIPIFFHIKAISQLTILL